MAKDRLFEEEKLHDICIKINLSVDGGFEILEDFIDQAVLRGIRQFAEKVRPTKHEQEINGWMKLYAERIEKKLREITNGKR